MYASYRCNGLSIPRLIYRAIGRFIFPPEIYRVGKKKKKKPIARSVIPTDVLLSSRGMAEILELVSSQPTLNRVHSFDAKIFSTISKRNSIVKIVSKRCLTNLCTPELLSNDQSASNRWKKKFMAIRGNLERCITRTILRCS